MQKQFQNLYKDGKYQEAKTVALKYKYFETTLQTLLRKKAGLLTE